MEVVEEKSEFFFLFETQFLEHSYEKKIVWVYKIIYSLNIF